MESIQLLVQEVKQIKDYRKARGQRYRLHNLLTIVVLSIIAGADDYVGISEYCKSKKEFLLKHNLIDGRYYPSHDLIRLVLQNLNKEQFAKLLSSWLRRAVDIHDTSNDSKEDLPQKMIHVDGKSLRATRSGRQHTRSALQIVTAYCSNDSISIGQSIIDKKSCEKTAIPQLLKIIDIKDSVVTIDAIASFKQNAALIIDLEADYLLALKKNNKHLFLEIESFFTHFEDTSLIVDIFQSEEKAHGRIEKRKCQIISDLRFFPDVEGWKNLQSIICIESQRIVNAHKNTVPHKCKNHRIGMQWS